MNERIRHKALLAIPHLVHAAQTRTTVTYSGLGAKIDVHYRHVRTVAGYIRDEICRPRDLPLLNCLIVNKRTGIPGESYLPGGTKAKTQEEKLREFEEFRDEVFEFLGWDDLLNELGLVPIHRTTKDLHNEARIYNKILKQKQREAESDDHRALKNFISHNPTVLDLPVSSTPYIEYEFLSGDRVDIAFDCGERGWAVVEVKVGLRGELVRGIYQAIKYRALSRAQHFKETSAFLIAYSVPKDIADLAEKHEVDTRAIAKAVVLS